MNFKQIAFSNALLKANSLIIAFLVWSTMCSTISIKRWIEIPIIFFNTESDIEIEAPKTMKIQVLGKKNIIDKLNNKDVAINIDAGSLYLGDNPYVITSENLRLAPSTNLVDYIPRSLIINTRKTNT